MLSDEEAQKLLPVVHSAGWQEVIEPRLLRRANSALKALVLHPEERARTLAGSEYNTADDVLRAMIRDVEWMVAVWKNELAVYNQNRRSEELQRQQNGENP